MKKISQEDIRFNLVVELGKAYDGLLLMANPDPDAMQSLAIRYQEAGMPNRAREILREVRLLTERRKSVPDRGIIEDVNPILANGGSNEKSIPLSIDIGIGEPAPVGSILPDAVGAGVR